MDTSVYTQISESEKRIIFFNVYIVCTVGITISMLILYLLINALLREVNNVNTTNDHYLYAIRCGIVSSFGSCLYFVIELLSNIDMILPLNNFIITNVIYVIIIDAFVCIFWLLLKVSLYFAFTFYYLSMFKKEKIDKYLKILMILLFIAAIIYGALFLEDGILHKSLKDIGYTQKGNICIISMMQFHNSMTATSATIIAMSTDIVYIIYLSYCYISSIKDYHTNFHLSDTKSYLNGIRAFVLLCISSIVFITCVLMNGTINSHIKYLMNSLSVIVNIGAVFLVFKENEKHYTNNLCSSLCDRYFMKLCIPSKYKPVGTKDIDDTDFDEGNDPSSMS